MAARQITGKKPKNFWFTFRTLLAYMGRHKFLFLAVAVLVTISALGNLLGTYMIRPVVNSVGAGDVDALARGVLATAAICGVGALAAFGYTQTMVYAAQQVLYDIRRDLFAHIQSLPLRFFDTQLHGDIMSYFTNDVDTVADALNNSFAMTIQSFIQLAGTLVLLFILNWQLSLIVVVGYAAMFLYIRFSAKRSTSYYTTQQAALGDVNGYIEEMVSGQKVVKVFNHEPANLRVFQAKNEALRQAGTGAQSYAATMVPAVVSISYINYAIVAVVGGLMALRGMTDIGSLSSYLVFVRQAAMPINQFTQQSNFLLAAMAGAERIFEAMRLPPEVDEGRIRLVNTRGEGVTLTACAEKTGRWAWQKPDGSLVPLRGDVRFHDVTFGYEKGRPILQNISLYAKPGQKIAFVGSTGAGKTTITNLINRFYDIDAGSRHLRRHRRAGHRQGLAAAVAGHRAAGHPPVHRHHCRQHPLRQAGRHPGGDRPRGPDRQRRQFHPAPAPGLRHPHHLGRRQPVPGPAAAAGHRPGGGGRPAGADPGRGHQLHRHPHRSPDRKRDGPADGGPHRLCHRPPAVHRPQRQRHHRAGARPGGGAGRPRRPAGPEGRILPAVQRDVRAVVTPPRHDAKNRPPLCRCRQGGGPVFI